MQFIKNMFKKYLNKETLLYIVFGVLTTLVNIGTFALLGFASTLSWEGKNIIAWIVSVLFAFVTNKIFVFESKRTDIKSLSFEVVSFFAARVFSLIAEYVILWIMIDNLLINEMISKLVGNVVVIIINYILSKLIVFRKK